MMRSRIGVVAIFCVAALGAAAPAFAAEAVGPAEQLTQLLEPLHTYSGDFQQRIEGGNGQAQQQAAGHMWLARPGKFRWEVKAPYAQTVVSNGKNVYLYDPDLQQVTIRNLDPKVTATPALLLSGSANQLTHDYDVSERGGSGQRIFTLTPHDQGSLFASLDMTFTGGQLTALDMTDPSGQRTAVTFSHITQNASIDGENFVFHIPHEADVVREQ